LLQRGWKLLGPAGNPLLLMFEGPAKKEDPFSILVPIEINEGPLLQRMIDAVAELAQIEDRYAGDVLTDMLQQASAVPLPANGPNSPAQTEPARK
jgi:hypothetical protein